ncbi:DUF4127 family protein [Desulfotruncus alcoholivorax]|uniref:DUF4127 family protein n=1 Tax=Desulfotruncus alcoholivorax TaxID=265477 RepID=UPI000400AFB0|nr:DUF4127 family protein [Desulfotruncus alcoholivorax]
MKNRLLFYTAIFSLMMIISSCNPQVGSSQILYLPLDDRPVNFKQVVELSGLTGSSVVYPDGQTLKNHAELAKWSAANARTSSTVIASLDALIYGGLVESRKHKLTQNEINGRIEEIKKLKTKNNRVYAFISIMRAPSANTPYTMPDYYSKYGFMIYQYGELAHKLGLGLANPAEIQRYNNIKATIPNELNDFAGRRQKNLSATGEILKLVQQGYIDHLTISKDDASAYGYSVLEAQKLNSLIKLHGIESKVTFLTGTDECGMLLLAAASVGKKNQTGPRIFVDYADPAGKNAILHYEDVPLDENVSLHINAIGAIRTPDVHQADMVLAVHNGPGLEDSASIPAGGQNTGARNGQNIEQNTEQNFVGRIANYIDEGKTVCLADVKLPNGADNEFMQKLGASVDLSKLGAYAGWNTPGNSLGIALSQGLIYHLYNGKDDHNGENAVRRQAQRQVHRQILLTRLIEDWGYQSVVRPQLKKEVPPGQQFLFIDREFEQNIAVKTKEMLNQFAEQNLAKNFGGITVSNVTFPWHRLFDVDFQLKD